MNINQLLLSGGSTQGIGATQSNPNLDTPPPTPAGDAKMGLLLSCGAAEAAVASGPRHRRSKKTGLDG